MGLKRKLKLAAGKMLYAFQAPFSSDKISMSGDEAVAILDEYYPNQSKGGCIANNEIAENPKYDLQIIVPCYNVEKYVEQCIDSILGQKTNYSFCLVLVNDGSKDNTGEIIKKYASQLNVRIITQENAGLSAARNAGLRHIDARYVGFVDSDDYLMPGAVEALMSAATRSGASIIQGGCYDLNGDVLTVNVRHEEGYELANRTKGFAWINIYKAEIFKDLRFPEGLWFEDTVNKFHVYWRAMKVYCVPNMIYAYRQVTTSICHTAKANKKVLDTYYVTERLLKDAKDLGYDFDSDYLHSYFGQVVCNCLRLTSVPKQVQKAVFVKEAEMLDWFNENAKPNNKTEALWQAMKDKDFGRYALWCKTHRL